MDRKKSFMFVVLLAILFLSGCDIDYELYIASDGTFNEEISNSNTFINNEDNVIYNLNELYGGYYKFEYIGDPSECVEMECYEEPNIYNTVGGIKKYYNVNDFLKSPAVVDYFGKIEYKKVGDVVTLKAKANEVLGAYITDVNYISASIDNLNIYIYSQYKVISNNADDIENDTYYWTFNKNNYNNRTTEISYDTSQLLYDFEINNTGGSLGNSNTNTNNNSSNDFLEIKTDNNTWIIIGIIALIVIIGVTSYLIIKKSKNNNI